MEINNAKKMISFKFVPLLKTLNCKTMFIKNIKLKNIKINDKEIKIN